MKHNLLKSVILSVILFMGVSNVWGKTVWIDVSNAPEGYTNHMLVHYWGGSENSYVPTTDYGTVNTYKIYKAEIPDDATHWQVCRGESNWKDNYQYDLDYSGANKYSVTGWENSGTGTKVIGMVKGGHIYFNNIDTEWNTTYLQFVIGHGSFSRTYAVGQITNTKLHYLNLTNESSHEWPDATYYGFIATEDGWFYDGDWSVSNLSNAKSYTAPYTSDYSLDAGSIYYCETNNTSNNSPFNINYESALTNLNHTQTIKYALSNFGGTPAVINSGTTPGKITMSSYKFVSGTYNAVSEEKPTHLSAQGTTYTRQFTAARTATTTLTVSEIEAGYKFDGWYDAETGDNILSSIPTYTYYPTSATTIYARFSEDNTLVVRGGEQFGNTWGSDVNVMTKKNEFEQIVYYTVSITGRNLEGSNTAYQFKIYDKTTDKWYGLAADDMHFWYTRDMGEQNLESGDNGKNIELRADVPGEYVIKVDYSNETKPKITITYPEKHTVTLHPVSDGSGNSGYGHFTVEHQGTRCTSSATETVIFEVAKGSTITIVESQHQYPDIYNGDICWRVTGTTWNDWKNINNPINYPITVNDDIEISDNFVVRKEAVDRDITPNAGVYVFLRIPKYLEHNNEGGWNHGQWDDGTPHENLGYPKNKFANFVYLKATKTPGHEVRGSKDADRGCADAGQKVGHFLMDTVHIADDQFSTYYCIITDSCWNTVKFERKHADSDDGEPQITCADVQFFPGGKNNCFTITGRKDDGAFIGTWGPAPKCKVTLGYTDIGRFGVEYNGEVIYEDKAKQEDGERDPAVIEVPFDAEIKVLAGEPGNDAFVNSMVYIDETGKKTKLDFTEQITSHTFKVKGDVTVDDLFGTKQDYIIYIGIPKNEDGSIREEFKDWDLACQQHAKDQMYIWCHWPYDGLGLSGDEYYGPDSLIKKIDEIHTDEKYLFYQYKLPKGVYTFNFQCKEDKDKDNNGSAHAASIFHYNPPLTTADCFILTGDKNDGKYAGYWTAMPSDGDFRILYVEQIVTKKEKVGDEWITEVKRTYEHSSDLIKPSELNTKGEKIVSLHIYTRGKNPEIILQKYDGTQKKWIDIEAHMVNGPLETDDPGMGLLPGRKNATPGSDIDDFVYDDGIEKIKNDPTDDGCGVWNFTVYKNGESAKLNLISDDGLKRYTGKYYIRTDNAEGQWIDYKKPTNYMTFSSYAKKNSGFSHYFCKWVDTKQHYRDVSFIVANDYAQSLTDPSYLFKDQYVDNQWLPENANVRWGWDIVTNKVSRAYIQGTWTTAEPPARLDNIVLKYKQSGTDIDSKDILLHDSGDWIYAVNLDNMQVGAYLNSLTAQYPKTGNTQYFAKDIEMLTGESSNKNKYVVRVQYDFKIDHTLIALLPNNQEANIGIDVVIERIDQKDATQVQASVNSQKRVTQEDGSTLTGSTVYGVFTFTKTFLTDNTLENQERFTHWFSFPFDVKLSDVFGFSPVGDYWMIRKYNGDKRAAEGLNETNTFWEYERNSEAILKANTGYILVLSTNLKYKDRDIYINRDTLSLYFPATDLVTNINSEYLTTEVDVPSHKNQNTTLKDWNWNMIGMPSYANKQATITQDHLYYFYDYSHKTNSYEVVWSGEKAFKSTFAYMVQFAGTINWKRFYFTKAQGLAPRERTDEEIQKHVLRLDLQRAGAREDKTYIQLIDENATTDFDMNLDLTKMLNSSKSNLYSLLNNHRLAANVLPIEETIIPLGVVTTTAGEYTFAMPDGTDGIVVELIDYETNTRTNMLLDNYTVNLGKGTFDNRFALHVKPDKTTTSVDNIGNEATGDKVKKYLIDGVLYMQKDGVLYDAQGRKL